MKIQPAATGSEGSCFWLFSRAFSPCSRVGHALRPVFMLWLTGEFTRKIYAASWLWQLKLTEFVSTCDVFNCLFPLDVQNEIQLLSGVFFYLWLVCLLGFWLRNTSLVKVGNPISDGIEKRRFVKERFERFSCLEFVFEKRKHRKAGLKHKLQL